MSAGDLSTPIVFRGINGYYNQNNKIIIVIIIIIIIINETN
jgi:hypothetical protein